MLTIFEGFSQIDNSIHCGELSRNEQEFYKRNKVKTMTSTIVYTFNSVTKRMEAFPKVNNVEVVHEFDKDGKLITRKTKDYYSDQMAVTNYEYDDFGRQEKVISTSSVFSFVLTNVYLNDSNCLKKYSITLIEEELIDSTVFTYEENKVYTKSFSERNEEILNVLVYNEHNLVSDDGDFTYEYQFNADGLLLKSVVTDKVTKEKNIVINEYQNGMLVLVRNYINEQLMQINKVEYKYF